MHLAIAYSKIKKRNLVLINDATYQRETLSERPIRQPLNWFKIVDLFTPSLGDKEAIIPCRFDFDLKKINLEKKIRPPAPTQKSC